MTAGQIGDMVSVFLPESSNEARILDQLAANIKKVPSSASCASSAGRSRPSRWPAILKAYVDAQWLEEFDARLADYRSDPGRTGRSRTEAQGKGSA